MYKPLSVAALAIILSLGIVTSAYAYAQQNNATGLQIALVPEIQRGHQQHLTIYAVDDAGNQINDTTIVSQIINERGLQVGPGGLTTESGETIDYKVGPNTRPQNITVFSNIEGSPIEAAQDYYVYPKGQAQMPQPIPPEPETESGGTETTPPPEALPPVTNTTQNTTSGNATQAFENLNNLTAILDEKIDEAAGNANETQRADLKAAIDELSGGFGQVQGLVVNATEAQLTDLEAAFAIGQEATNQVFDDGDE